MDAARANVVDAELGRLIERRSRKGEVDPDEREEAWKASVRRYNEHRRQQLRIEWHAYFCRLAACLRSRAEEYDRRAERLMEEEPKGGVA